MKEHGLDGQTVRVEFYSCLIKLHEITGHSGTYTFQANTAGVAPGTYPVHVVATDNLGATAASGTIFVTLR